MNKPTNAFGDIVLLEKSIIPDFGENIKKMRDIIYKMENCINTGFFQYEDGKKELNFLKSQFGKIFDLLLSFDEIGSLNLEGYGLLCDLKIDNQSSFSFIKDIYSLIENYFENLQESDFKDKNYSSNVSNTTKNQLNDVFVDKNGGNNRKEIVKNHLNGTKLKTPKIFTKDDFWYKIGNMFDLKDLSINNCYEMFDGFDWSKCNLEDIKLFLKDFKSALRSKKSLLEDQISFLKVLIQDIDEYLRYQEFNLQKKLEEEKKNKIRLIWNDFLYQNLYIFDEFIVWAKTFINNNFDFSCVEYFSELELDKQKLSEFELFKTNFCRKYSVDVLKQYKEKFISNEELKKYGDFGFFDKLLSLGNMYKDFSLERFFISVKRGFLFGDVYEILIQNIDLKLDIENSYKLKIIEDLKNYSDESKLKL